MYNRLPLGLALATLLAAGSVQAEPLVTAADPEQIAQLVRGFGSAVVDQDEYGDPLITGRIEGTKYGIFFYNCTDGADCKDIQFAAAWSDKAISRARINEWNRDMRFGKAYLDDEGDPNLEMAVNLRYGVSTDNFDDTIDWWRVVTADFETFMQQQESTTTARRSDARRGN
ncbi:putative sensory transduction regulator [Marinobacterium halophilum]|uniref:Putative sensory transduction regulator n=1 Tax=Marinobacterium halophilum TaxID=267374 RepID=A0A2P8ERZ4_9GAMM|nr:YbjN domain-containing protein [Marinobacterium halophilum]PSL12259.1 putative sensory transduction regulator [Marinobacterium halophilum]